MKNDDKDETSMIFNNNSERFYQLIKWVDAWFAQPLAHQNPPLLGGVWLGVQHNGANKTPQTPILSTPMLQVHVAGEVSPEMSEGITKS